MNNINNFWGLVAVIFVVAIILLTPYNKPRKAPDAYYNGWDAFGEGKSFYDNPYPEGSEDHTAWSAGYEEQQQYFNAI